ncbi:hypothetical protein HZS_2183, partial [Henneguya salminicola]
SYVSGALSLIKTNNGLPLPSTVLSGVIAFGEIDNIIWAVTESDSKPNLHIIKSDGDEKKTQFPRFLKPSKFHVFSSNSRIYTIVRNETNRILLYSASLKDLRFVRIGENIRPSYNSSIEPCIAVETFDSLPGVLIMNIERAYNEHQMIFTAISFNYGSGHEDYSGLFLSLDAGYSWELL